LTVSDINYEDLNIKSFSKYLTYHLIYYRQTHGECPTTQLSYHQRMRRLCRK